jgi:hypothetical protein
MPEPFIFARGATKRSTKTLKKTVGTKKPKSNIKKTRAIKSKKTNTSKLASVPRVPRVGSVTSRHVIAKSGRFEYIQKDTEHGVNLRVKISPEWHLELINKGKARVRRNASKITIKSTKEAIGSPVVKKMKLFKMVALHLPMLRALQDSAFEWKLNNTDAENLRARLEKIAVLPKPVRSSKTHGNTRVLDTSYVYED